MNKYFEKKAKKLSEKQAKAEENKISENKIVSFSNEIQYKFLWQ